MYFFCDRNPGGIHAQPELWFFRRCLDVWNLDFARVLDWRGEKGADVFIAAVLLNIPTACRMYVNVGGKAEFFEGAAVVLNFMNIIG